MPVISPYSTPTRTPRSTLRAQLRLCTGALVCGAISALAAAPLRLLYRVMQWVFTGNAGTLPSAAAALPLWYRVALPAAGSLVAFAILRVQVKRSKGQHYTDYIDAIQLHEGDIPFVSTVWRTASAAFSVATGAAIGREGSMIQFAGAATSWFGKRFFPTVSLQLKVACGIAGGIATAYQAPIAGMFFAYELALGSSAKRRDYLPLALAGFSGWLLSKYILGPGPLFHITAPLGHPSRIWLCLALLALILGLIGPAYQTAVRKLSFAENLPVPLFWGGLSVGLVSIFSTEVWGNGDQALLNLVRLNVLSSVTVKMTLSVLLLRVLTTAVCIGVGTIGGIFTPTLFAGAALGYIFAFVIHAPYPTVFVLVGMGALMASITHAPLMSSFVTAELTGEWKALPVLLFCFWLSAITARRLSPHKFFAVATAEPTHAAASLAD